jgi:hypothetical protein
VPALASWFVVLGSAEERDRALRLDKSIVAGKRLHLSAVNKTGMELCVSPSPARSWC